MPRIHWLDIPLAPLYWLERARGRRRVALAGLYGLVLVVGGSLVGREAVLWQLPAAPEPFDLARYGHVDLPEVDNAMVFTTEAGALLVADRGVFAREDQRFNDLFLKVPSDAWDWNRADAADRAWLAANRDALAVWLTGTYCRDAVAVPPERRTLAESLDTVSRLRVLCHLGMLEATRRQAEGDLAGAWVYHRGVIRSGLHAARHGGINTAMIGSGILRLALPSVTRWLEAPGMTPDLLHQAILDLAACRGLATTPADLIRAEYFADRAQLSQLTGTEANLVIRWFGPDQFFSHLDVVSWTARYLRNEPKRSLTLLRLITAGRLAQAKLPAGERAPRVSRLFPIHAINEATPPQLARIKPATLVAWVERSDLISLSRPDDFLAVAAQAGQDQLEAFRLQLAERAYTLDHNGQPARTYGDYIPAYLDALPAGIASDDLLAVP